MTTPRTRWLAVACILPAALLAGCSSEGDAPTEGEAPASTATADSDGGVAADGESDTGFSVELVDSGADVSQPMDAHPVGDSLLVAEREGRVVELVEDGSGGLEVAGTVVDLGDEVGSTDAEKGLLGLTTDADGQRLFVNHTRASDGATVIAGFELTGAPGSLSAEAPRELLVIDQPFPNHNGGDILWGPDDMLWIGTGDGGAADDPDGRSQRLGDPLGKILRLDPSLEGTGTDLAPADNPYASGDDGNGGEANPLVWARGVRNPWRMSFDADTGDLWVADVGQNEVEEVTVLRAADDLGRGGDLGWDRLEGDQQFAEAGPEDGWPTDAAVPIDPLHTYGHDEGCSISGGFVYRGTALSPLSTEFLFSDYCNGRIQAVSQDGQVRDLGLSGAAVVSINADAAGEPLVLDSTGISRIVPA